MIEATARTYGHSTSGLGRLIFPGTGLAIPGVCAQPVSQRLETPQLRDELAKLAGVPSCTKGTFVIGLRGTFEPSGTNNPARTANLGGPVGELVKQLQESPKDPNGVTPYGVSYPANIGEGETAGIPTAGYLSSVTQGAAKLLAVLAIHLQCPGEKIVLAGYSQGAQVIRVALGLLPPDLRAKINHVVLFSDPKFVPAIGNLGIDVDDLADEVPTNTYCHAGDFLCTGTSIGRLVDCFTKHSCPHFGYESEAGEAARRVKDTTGVTTS